MKKISQYMIVLIGLVLVMAICAQNFLGVTNCSDYGTPSSGFDSTYALAGPDTMGPWFPGTGGGLCTQSFTVPSGKNRVTEMKINIKSVSGTQYMQFGVTEGSAYDAPWIKTVSKTLTSSSTGWVTMFSGDESTVYTGGKQYYIRIKLVAPSPSGYTNVVLNTFTNNPYSGGALYIDYDIAFSFESCQTSTQSPVTCWKCSGEEAVSKEYPYGTDCSDTSYPYSSEPSCGGGEDPFDVTIESYDDKGTILPDCIVKVDGTVEGTTDSSGELVVSLAEGNYEIKVSKAGYNTYTTSVDISDDRTIYAVLTGGTSVVPDYTLNITLIDTKNQKVFNGLVTLVGTTVYGVTDLNGFVSLSVAQSGSYTIQVVKEGYQDVTQVVGIIDSDCPNGYCNPIVIIMTQKGIPGFEFVFLVFGIVIAVLIFKRRKE